MNLLLRGPSVVAVAARPTLGLAFPVASRIDYL